MQQHTAALRKMIDGKLRCKNHNNGKGAWLTPESFPEKKRASTGRSANCKECYAKYKVKKNERSRLRYHEKRPKVVWLHATPHKQSPLSNIMACNLWNQELNFERLRA